ncbi:tetratricopeptide repeat protein [Sphingobium sp. Sx8-8]|uniref:tetratricopeptide repeat protein n=1 Tax=Sphingobium sp. Sx8-8 TaxID=2933617 RepID=UPI001F59DB34|nr:tetratricopeptide repeat protein [Sphingobium sp. Sx8-8]
MAVGGRKSGKLWMALLLSIAAPLQAQAPYVADVTEAREKEWRKLAAASQAAYSAGQAADGIDTARKALGLADELFGKDDPRSLISANDLALQLESAGHFREAESLFRRVFDSYLQTRGEDDPNTQLALENLIDFYMARKRYDAAAPLADYALVSFRRVTGAASARSQRMAQIVATMPKMADPLAEKPTATGSEASGAAPTQAEHPAPAVEHTAQNIAAPPPESVEKMSMTPKADQAEMHP